MKTTIHVVHVAADGQVQKVRITPDGLGLLTVTLLMNTVQLIMKIHGNRIDSAESLLR